MEIISSKRFVLWTLAASSLLTSNIFCTDELVLSSLHSKKNYDTYSEPRRDSKWEKQRSLNFEELKDWGPKNVIKMSTPVVNKMPPLAANLPLRFGRTEEESSPGAIASLPLRFGRNTEDSMSRVPNLPQRFGRTKARSITKALGALLQQSTRSPSAKGLLYSITRQPQEIQKPDQKNLRRPVSRK
uniref:Pro-FMRFamide-related neuropeptide VF n=1 Tax=Sus scrofa TaxID=9823 RepID=A0A4X1U1S4_PIG